MDFTEVDSKEEVYFSWWLDELLSAGFIESWGYHSETFALSDRVQYQVRRQLKTKIRVDDMLLLHPHTYTPDFVVRWEKKADGVFYNNVESGKDLRECPIVAQAGTSHIDIKPKAWGRGDSFMALFSVRQKWVYDKHGVFIQPVVVTGKAGALFERTFVPERFLTTDISGAKRKINFKTLSLQEFIKEAL